MQAVLHLDIALESDWVDLVRNGEYLLLMKKRLWAASQSEGSKCRYKLLELGEIDPHFSLKSCSITRLSLFPYSFQTRHHIGSTCVRSCPGILPIVFPQLCHNSTIVWP